MRILFFSIATLLFIAGCSSDDTPQPNMAELTPVKLEQAGYIRELNYNISGNLNEVVTTYRYANGLETKSIQVLDYNDDGLLIRSTTDSGWRLEYTYDGNGRLVKTNEYTNDSWWQLHTYEYNEKGLLLQSITFQNIPEEGGIIPVSKDMYEYDVNENVVVMDLYYYTSYGAESKLLTKFVFSDYDTKKNSEEYFNVHPFNPTLLLRKNNPGKMIVSNAKGIVSSTDVYSYTYNKEGYAIAKTTTQTMYNGETGSYTTQYYFK